MAVFENKGRVFDRYRSDSQAFLYRIRDALSNYSVKIVGARGQAVRLFYTAAPHVDIAPVFKWSGDGAGYALPDGKGGWLTTDPDFHQKHMADRNADLSSLLKPFVRMLKRWNRVHGRPV
jgi:Second Messenger Oligonucleotide or Dinucleotide Synthetase domain